MSSGSNRDTSVTEPEGSHRSPSKQQSIEQLCHYEELGEKTTKNVDSSTTLSFRTLN